MASSSRNCEEVNPQQSSEWPNDVIKVENDNFIEEINIMGDVTFIVLENNDTHKPKKEENMDVFKEEFMANKLEGTNVQDSAEDVLLTERNIFQNNNKVCQKLKKRTDEASYASLLAAQDNALISKDNLSSQIEIQENGKSGRRVKRINQCPICLKHFNHPSNLVTHFRIHSGERPFQCPHCTNSFTQASTLDRHILTHTGEKSFQCPHCPKSFSRKFSLTSHLHTHTGVKAYMCEYCSKCFRDRSALNKHFLIHTGEKQYMCHLCSKCFSYKSALNTHMRVHSGEKPFRCEECARCFSDKNNLKAHYIVHSSEKRFKCDVCSKSFKHSSGLKKHIVCHSRLKIKEYHTVSEFHPTETEPEQTSTFSVNVSLQSSTLK